MKLSLFPLTIGLGAMGLLLAACQVEPGAFGNDDHTMDGPWAVPDKYADQAGSRDEGAGVELSGAGGAGGAAGPSGGESTYDEVRAGDYDDNAAFGDYLEYLGSQGELEGVLKVDVSERYVLTVVAADSGEPLVDARVALSLGGAEVWAGRTTTRGRVLVHPRAIPGVSDEDTALDVEVTIADSPVGTAVLERSPEGGALTLSVEAAPEPVVAVDLALVVDTTGSMGDEIADLKATWLDIAAQIAAMDDAISLRVSLVIYRDRGDAYVVKYLPFTDDVKAFETALSDVAADGGGDYPEDLQAALDVTVNDLAWREGALARVAFVLADAAPHLYEDGVPYTESIDAAVAKGIRVHTIGASGSGEDAEYVLRQIAQQTLGHFLFLTYDNDIPGQPGTGGDGGGDDGYSVGDYVSGSLDELVVRLVEQDVSALQAPEVVDPGPLE